MRRIIFLLILLMSVFGTIYSGEKNIEEVLKEQWSIHIKDGDIYYGKQKLDNLDYLSFEQLNDYYLKDKNGVYSFRTTVVVTGWETLEFYENYQNENWYADKESKQWYSLEAEARKMEHADLNNYIFSGQYLFSGGYAMNRGNIVNLRENIYFQTDMKTLKVIDNNILKCDSNDLECKFQQNILVKDKSGVYALVDGYEQSTVYKLINVDISSFEKTGDHLYKDKNREYTAEDINKRAVRILINQQ